VLINILLTRFTFFMSICFKRILDFDVKKKGENAQYPIRRYYRFGATSKEYSMMK